MELWRNGLVNEDENYEGAKKITISFAINWIKRSWTHEVRSETIINCWQKVGFDVANDVEIVGEENPVAADIEELLNLDEDIVVYEDTENWENEVLFPADVEEWWRAGGTSSFFKELKELHS